MKKEATTVKKNQNMTARPQLAQHLLQLLISSFSSPKHSVRPTGVA